MFVFLIISVLGSDGGTRSMINRCKQCLQVAIENTTNVISPSEDRDFYISWAGKTFSAKEIALSERELLYWVLREEKRETLLCHLQMVAGF